MTLLLLLVWSASAAIRVTFLNETYDLPPMRFLQLKRMFNVYGGHIRTPNIEDMVHEDADSIREGELVVPPTALPYKQIHPLKEAFFDRVKYRERSGETRFARTMRNYWAFRPAIMAEHFGKYVYFCGGTVHQVADNPDGFLNIRHPCGSETALIARVGAEIDTSYTYNNQVKGSLGKHESPEGEVVSAPVASMDFEIMPQTTDRRQQNIRRYQRFDNMIIDTGAEEINVMYTDFPMEDFPSAREVENRGLHGTGIARFVPLRVKFSEHREYRTTYVLVNDDVIEHRLVGMRFLQNFYVMFGGPEGKWAAEPNRLIACSHFLDYDESQQLVKAWADQVSREEAERGEGGEGDDGETDDKDKEEEQMTQEMNPLEEEP